MQSAHQGEITLAGDRHVYGLRRSRRAKRLLLKVDWQRGIEVVLPRWATYRDGTAFIQSRQDWLAKVLQRRQLHFLQPARALTTGETIPCLGAAHQLQIQYQVNKRRPRVWLEDNQLHVRVPSAKTVHQAITHWYRHRARRYFTEQCGALAGLEQTSFRGIIIGNQRTRWGSCSSTGRLSFNWRLLLAPISVAQYVAAHEVAHLRYPNHSPQFWQAVEHLCPNFKEQRQWLKKHGHTLVL